MNTVAQIQAAKSVELVAFYNEFTTSTPVKKFKDRATAEARCTALIAELALKNAPADEVAPVAAEVAPVATVEVAPVADVAPEAPATVEVAPVVEEAPAAPAPAPAATEVEEDDKEFKMKAIHAYVLTNIARSDYTSVNGAEPNSTHDVGFPWMNCVVDTAKDRKALTDLIEAGLVITDGAKGADACVTLTQAGLVAYKLIPAQAAGEQAAAEHKEKVLATSNAAGVAASWKDPKVIEARLQRDGVRVTRTDIEGSKPEEFRSVRAAFTKFNLPDSKHIRFRMKLKASKSEVFEYQGANYKFEII